MPRKNSGASADTRLPNLREESPGFSSSPGSQPAIQHKPSSRSSRPAGPGESTTTPPPTQPNFSSTPNPNTNASSGTTSAQPVQIPMPPRSNLTALRDLHRDRGDSSSPSPAATPSPMGSLRHHPHHHHHGHPPHLGRLSELANSASEFTGSGGGSGSVPPIVSTPPGASMRRPSLAGGGPAPFASGVGLADLGSGGDYFPVPAPPAHGITGATPPSAGGVRGPSPAHPEEVVVQGGGGGGPSSLSTSYQSGSIHTRMAGSGVSVPIGGYSHPREREPKEKEKEKEKDPAPAPTTDGAGGSRSTRKPSHGETTLPSTTGTGSMRTTITVETYRPGDSSTITTPGRLPSSSSSTVPKQQQQQPSGSATKQIQQQFTGGSSATSVLGMTPNRKPSHAHLTKPSVAAATGLTTATVSAPPPSTYVSPQTTGVNTGVTAGPGGPSRQTSMANLQHQYASTQAQRERVPNKPKDKEGTVVPSSARPSMATPLASTPSLVQQVLVTRSASQSQRQPPQDQPRRVSRETNASQAQPQPQTSTSAAVPVTRHHSDVPTTRDREREPVKATKTELPHTTSATAVLQTTPATASTIRQGQDTTPARAPQRQQQPLKVAIPAAPTTAAAAQPSPSSTDQERSIELSEEEGGRSQPQSKSGSRSQSQSQSRSRGGNSKSGSRSATSSAQAQQSQSQARPHTLQNMASSQTFSATTSASGVSDRVPYPPLSSATTEHDGEAIPDKSLPSRSASQSRQTSPRVPYPPLRSQASVSVMSQSISAMGELRSPPRVARPLAGKAGPAGSQRPGHSRTPSHTAFSSNTRPDPSNDHDRERAVESRIEQLEAAAARQAPPSSTPAVTTEAQTTTMMVPIEYRSPPSVPADIQVIVCADIDVYLPYSPVLSHSPFAHHDPPDFMPPTSSFQSCLYDAYTR
ncbi:hypothetical protein DL93DRAFT_242758 [Clavulina sp. PMI_390]|nr:hypothetical protein DL93DRAFT_242758 [Clavulina sp. PMI_390]